MGDASCTFASFVEAEGKCGCEVETEGMLVGVVFSMLGVELIGILSEDEAACRERCSRACCASLVMLGD